MALIPAAYLLGCFSTGYYLVRLRSREDIRELGSGTAGAKNVGRKFGAWGFIVTFLGDLAKGAIAVAAGTYLGLGQIGLVVVMIAVVLGHIWPVQLGFRGGKGISTSLGAILVFNWLIGVIVLGIFVLTFALTRKFTLSGVAAAILSPLVPVALRLPATSVIGVSALAVLIVFAHRKNIAAEIGRIRARGQLGDDRSNLLQKE